MTATPGYAFETEDGKRLHILPPGFALPPGDYVFYFLGRSHLLIAAQLVRRNLGEVQRALQEAFDFTDEDLKANKRGVISKQQTRPKMRDLLRGGWHIKGTVRRTCGLKSKQRLKKKNSAIGGIYYQAVFGEKHLKFALNTMQYHALYKAKGLQYCVYWSPEARRLLSIEPVWEDQPID